MFACAVAKLITGGFAERSLQNTFLVSEGFFLFLAATHTSKNAIFVIYKKCLLLHTPTLNYFVIVTNNFSFCASLYDGIVNNSVYF